MPKLKIKTGEKKGEEVSIEEDPFVIGRSQEVDLQITDEGISREHARIFRIGSVCFIKDLESTNETILNGETIEHEELLQPGDRIQLGTTVLIFEDEQDIAPPGQEGEEKGTAIEQDSGTLGEDTTEIHLGEEEDQDADTVGTERSPRSLQVLYKLGKLIGKTKDPHTMLTEVQNLAVETVDADGACVFLIDENSGRLEPVSTFRKENVEETGISRTIVKRVLRQSRAVMTSDAETDERFSTSQSVVLKGIKSVIAAPMAGSDDIQGILYLYSKTLAGAFTEEDFELITAIAIQTGLALSELSARKKIRSTMISAVKMLVRAIEAKKPEEKGHSERVAGFSTAIARELRLESKSTNNLQIAALLHDIGKIVGQEEMPPNLKNLDDPAAHVEMGVRILQEAAIFDEVVPGVKYHHFRLDGSGYPEEADSDEIPDWVHVLIVANVFDNILNQTEAEGKNITTKSVIKDLRKRAKEQEFREEVVQALDDAYERGTLFHTDPSIETLI